MRPCRGENFTAFVSRFQNTCCSRSGSPRTGPAPASKSVRSSSSFSTAAGRIDSTAVETLATTSTGLHVEPHPAAEDPGQIEQVIDQVRLLLGVPDDRLQRSAHDGGIVLGSPEHLRPAQDGVQGRPELVRQGSEEVVLGAVRRLGLGPRLPLSSQQLLVGLLRLLLVGDVPGDLRRADDPAPRIAHGRDRQRDVQATARLVDPDGLIVLDALSATDAVENLRLLLDGFGRNQHGDGPADRLGWTVAEQASRPGIPRLHDAIEILADDRVVGRLDDGREASLRLIHPLALDRERNVPGDDPAQHDLRVRQASRRVEIGHELAQTPARLEQWEEGEPADALGEDRRAQGSRGSRPPAHRR